MALELMFNFSVPQLLMAGRGAHTAVSITEQGLEPWTSANGSQQKQSCTE